MGTHINWMMSATWIDDDEEYTDFSMWEVELRGGEVERTVFGGF